MTKVVCEHQDFEVIHEKWHECPFCAIEKQLDQLKVQNESLSTEYEELEERYDGLIEEYNQLVGEFNQLGEQPLPASSEQATRTNWAHEGF